MSIPTFDAARPLLLEYASEFVRGYKGTIDEYFSDTKRVILAAGRVREYFPLYGRQLGVDLAIAAFYTQIDFYLFFLDKPDTEIAAVRSAIADATSGFGWEWSSYAPDDRRIQKVKEYLGLEQLKVLQPAPSLDAINIPGTNFMARDIVDMRQEGFRHGVDFGNQAGARAEAARSSSLPAGETKSGVYQLFVIMPFGQNWSDGIYALIRRAAGKLDIPQERIRLYRADEIASPGQISDQIKQAIDSADVVIADITDVNPNVMWELGFADGRG